MIIVISGSVGTGKTKISDELSKKLDCEVMHLNEIAQEYKISDVKELMTFDFDLDALIEDVESEISDAIAENRSLVVESHFAHFINPQLVDYLFVLNRNLKELEKVYEERGYNKQKISDNLEAESFNVCFYEAVEEGYEEEKQVFTIDNTGSFEETLNSLLEFIRNS